MVVTFTERSLCVRHHGERYGISSLNPHDPGIRYRVEKNQPHPAKGLGSALSYPGVISRPLRGPARWASFFFLNVAIALFWVPSALSRTLPLPIRRRDLFPLPSNLGGLVSTMSCKGCCLTPETRPVKAACLPRGVVATSCA